MYSGEINVHEYGTIYVREKGELSCVNYAVRDVVAPPRERPKLHRLFDKDFSVQLCIGSLTQTSSKRKDHFVFTYNKEGSLRYTAKSLLDMALSFIADNVQHVDSLVGFPEQMADRLFAAAEEKQKFSDPETAPRALQLFSEAYGELVLKSLCLRNRCPLLSERLEEIKVFQSLKCLDLYGCRLGDSHDIFRYLTSEALASLVQLFLGANCLSDTGLQKLTAPVRVMKRGLGNLQLLDLSYNLITEKALGYVACFPKLQGLDISETKVKLGTSLNRLLWNRMGLVLSKTPLKAFCHTCCKTEGWAEQIISQWEAKASELPKKDSKPRTNALRFYGREKFVRQTLNSVPTSCDKEEGKMVRIQFYKPDPSMKTDLAGTTSSQTMPAAQKGRKRGLSSEREERTERNPPAKRLSSTSTLSAEDLDLLNSY